ncbi:glycoside hydrolase family 16 protein [Auriscalpium vulgare]|uniref:Glycoside hydrolase family 16 protein n=1 Tax=Auriscalpium vulgare TaxID=40419 RepID=A0ACB8SC61_9AGAM|nr:glycoside hydrolase family 16 protein [Auriscalpium vulgare]
MSHSDSPFLAPTDSGLTTPSSTASLVPAAPYAKFSRGHTPDQFGSFYSYHDAPYPDSFSKSGKRGSGLEEKFSLSPDPQKWGLNVSPEFLEADDDMHNPDERKGKDLYHHGDVFTVRGITNVGCLLVLCVGIVALFAGYPIATALTRTTQSTNGGFNLGGTNASGQLPMMIGGFGLIDPQTPRDVYTRKGVSDGADYELVFSDEFNTDGRTFYPGDDPYWEAVDLHYWATNNMEWYDPAAITTSNGSLVITLSQKETHGLDYQGGMMSSWNKFCYTGGYLEVSVMLPGLTNVVGLWPSVWTMGNLGRAGYGASLEGMWPYSYDSCDVGTLPNQTMNGAPAAALINGDPEHGGALSYLPGQRLSRCTCNGESHPGPKHSDGSLVGRAAPEIDVFEAQVRGSPVTLEELPLMGEVSQSAQWAPMNAGYVWLNNSDNMIIYDKTITAQNTYTGGITQQAASVVSVTNQDCYEGSGRCYSTYGFEYKPGFDDAYITWISSGVPSWTLKQAGMAADPNTQIAARPIPQEPMYIIMNMGMSTNFGLVDVAHIPFPVHMYIDYVRVYQPSNARNVGCDPSDFPTSQYINTYPEAYNNPNLTTWVNDYGKPFPKNKLVDQC